MSQIIRPCNGLGKCWRHPTGCAKIVLTAREEYALRQMRKTRRRRLWNIVLENYKLRKKWAFNIGEWAFGPVPRQHHLNMVLLLEQLLGEEELHRSIDSGELKREQEQRLKKQKAIKFIRYFSGRDI